MPNEDVLLNIWNASKDTYDIGDFESFKQDMNDPSARANFHKAASSKFSLGDIASFENDLGYGQPKKKAPPLPSNLNPQQVKSYLSRYGGREITDNEATELSSMISGKSTDEALLITTDYFKPKVTAQPMAGAGVMQTGYQAPEQPLVMAPTPESQYTGVIPEQVDYGFGAVAQEIARPKSDEEVKANITKTMLDEYSKADKDLEYIFEGLDSGYLDVESQALIKSLAPDYNVPIGSMNDQQKEDVKNRLRSFKAGEKSSKLITNLATVKSLQQETTNNIAKLTQEINDLSIDPQSDQTEVKRKQRELLDQITINQISNKTYYPIQQEKERKAIYDSQAALSALPLSQRTAVGAKQAGMSIYDIGLTMLNSAGEFYNKYGKYTTFGPVISLAELALSDETGTDESGRSTTIGGEFLKNLANSQKENLQKYKEEQPEYLATTVSILDGLNFANVGQASGQLLGSMGAVMAASYSGGPVAGFAAGYAMVYGDAVDEARKAGYNEIESELYGQILAVGSGVLEEVPVAGLLKGFTTSMLRKSVLRTIRTELAAGVPKEQIIKKVIDIALRTGAETVLKGVPEGVTEVLQTGQEYATKLAFNKLAKEEEDPGFKIASLEEIGKQSAESFVLGFFGGGFTAGAGEAFTGSQSYSKLASAAIRDNDRFNNLNVVADGLLASGRITQQQRDSFVGNLKIAVEAKAAVPKYIKDDNVRQRAIELILNKKQLESEMASVDPSMADGYKSKLISIQAELKSIADQKWKAPANPVIFSSVDGLEAMTHALTMNSSKENSAGIFVSTLADKKGFVGQMLKSIEEEAPIAKPLVERTVSSLEALAKSFSSAPVKTEMTQKAAEQAQQLADQLKSYGNIVDSVATETIPGMDISAESESIAMSVPIAQLNFMNEVPSDIMEAYQGIVNGEAVSPMDAANIQDFLYEKYNKLNGIKDKLQKKINKTTDPAQAKKLNESLLSIKKVQANLSQEIRTMNRYKTESAINENATGVTSQQRTKAAEGVKESVVPVLTEEQLAEMEYDVANPSQAVLDADMSPEVRKLLNAAVKFIEKLAPNAKVYVHATAAEYSAAVEATTGDKNAGAMEAGKWVPDKEGKTGSVHFNIEMIMSPKPEGTQTQEQANKEALRTFAHEAMHVALQETFGNDQAAFKSFQDKIGKLLSSADSKELKSFVARYKEENYQAEEFLAELGGIMSSEARNIPKPLFAKIAKLINDFIVAAATKVGFTVDRNLLFKDTLDTVEVVNFFNTLASGTRTGFVAGVEQQAAPLKQRASAAKKKVAEAAAVNEEVVEDEELPVSRERVALGDLRDNKHFMFSDLKYPDVVFKDIDTESEANIAINFYKKIVDKFNKEFDRDVKLTTEKTADGRFAVVVEYETGLKPKYFSYPTAQMGEHHIVDALTNEVPLTSLRHELIHEMLVKHITDKFERINTLDKSADAATVEEVQRNRAFNYTLEDVFFERLVENIERQPDGVDTFEIDTYGTDVTNRLNEEIDGPVTKEKVMATLGDLLEGSNPWLAKTLNNIFAGLDYTKIKDIRTAAEAVGAKFKQRYNQAKDILPKDLQRKIYDFTELFNQEYQGVQTRLAKQAKPEAAPAPKARKTAATEAQLLFTTATQRGFNIETKKLVDLTDTFDKLIKLDFKGVKRMGVKEFNKQFSETAASILTEYANVMKIEIPKLKAKYNFGEPFLGSWQTFFEPSMNLNLSITDQTDTAKLSDLINKIAEETSQDAYIIEMTSELDAAYRKDKNNIQLSEELGDGISVYPQVMATFIDELTPTQRAELGQRLKAAGFDSFSIGPDFAKMSVFDGGASKEENVDRVKERAERIAFVEEQRAIFEAAVKGNETFSKGVIISTHIKRSAYVSGTITGKDELQRKYDRRDVFEAFKPGVVPRARKAAGGPARGNRLFNEPIPEVKTLASKYFESTFGRPIPNYTGTRRLDTANSKRISDAFTAMKHDPQNLEVAKAYRQMVKETIDQYDTIIAAGYSVTINNNEPYSNSADMIDDLRNNKTLNIFSTESGFGDNPITDQQRRDNPLLAKTKYKDTNGVPLLANDLFRFVHDFFGHAELGNSFGAKGEENAWNVHARMYSPLARKAMTTETRGQNSYVNFSGVNKEVDALREKGTKQREQGDIEGADETTNKIYELTKFADQKVGLLPDEFSTIDETDEGDRQEELGLPIPGPRSRMAAAQPKNVPERVGREGGIINGTNLKVTGKEKITPGKTTFTIYEAPTKEQRDKGNTAGKRKETFGLEDIKKKAINSNSAIVNRAEMLSSGLFKYKYDEVDENNKKTGKKISGEYPLPYSNPKANRAINQTVKKARAIVGTSVEAKAEKKRLLDKLKKEIIPVYEQVISTMAENIRALYDTLTPEFIEQSKKWYEGANRFANSLASTYNISVEQSSGMLAVLSPQKDWFNNVSAGERVMDIMSNHTDKPFTKELLDNAVKYNSKGGKVPNWVNDIKKQFKATEGMSINDMQNQGISMAAQANLLRILDHYYNSPNVLQTTPDGQVIGYGESTIMWNPASEIGRAMMIFRDPAQSNIEVLLGEGNKVRNFYNNIVDPNSEKGYLTADTHALGVAFGLPTSANDAGAFKLFSGGEESIYAIVKDAYTIVANELGLLPRELQSITWEAFRTGTNDKNRTKAKNKANFDMMLSQRKQGIDPYTITQSIINENRSTDPEWAKELGINTQKGLSEIREGAERAAQQRAGQDVPVRGQQRERVGGAGTGVVQQPSGEPVTPRSRRASKAIEAYPELATTKVVNEDGSPKIVYHGGLDFKGFKKGETKGDAGIYFTDNPDFALYFAHQAEIFARDKRNDDYSDVPERLLESGDPFPEKYFKYAKVQKVYLDMKDPKIVDAIDARAIPNAYGKGKDGFIAKTTGDFGYSGGQYVVFEPSQIKDADPKVIDSIIGQPTSRSRRAAEPEGTYYDPSRAATEGTRKDRETQVEMYNSALAAHDEFTGSEDEKSVAIYSAVKSATGVDLSAVSLARLLFAVQHGIEPSFDEKRGGAGQGPLAGARTRNSAVKARIIQKLSQAGGRVNKKLVKELNKTLKYTVENQTEAMEIASIAVKEYGGIDSPAGLDGLFNLANEFSGAVTTFVVGDILNQAYKKAKEATQDTEARRQYTAIANRAAYHLAERARENGREIAALYRLYLTSPEGLYMVEAARMVGDIQKAFASPSQAEEILRLKSELNKAKTEAAAQAAKSAAVEAAKQAALGRKKTKPTAPTTTTTPPPAKPPATKPAEPSEGSVKKENSLIKGIKDRLKALAGFRSRRTLPAGVDAEVVDYLSELARVHFERGTFNFHDIKDKIAKKLFKESITLTDVYYDEMWNDIFREAHDEMIKYNASALAERIVAKAKAQQRSTAKIIDPIKLMMDELLGRATQDIEGFDNPKMTEVEKLRSLLYIFNGTGKPIWTESKDAVSKQIDALDPTKYSDTAKQELKNKLNSFYTDEISNSLPRSAQKITATLEQDLKDRGIELDKILLKSDQIIADTRDEFISNLVDRIVTGVGLTYSQAQDIADAFTAEYDAKVDRLAEKALRRFVPKTKNASKILKKSAAEKAFEMIRYGAIDANASLTDEEGNTTDLNVLFAEIFGLPVMTNEIRDTLKAFADAISKTPVNSVIRQQIYNNMMLYIQFQKIKDSMKSDIFVAQVYNNVLLSTDTMLKAFNSNIVNWPLEFITQSSRAAFEGDFRLIPLLVKGYFGKKGKKGTDVFGREGFNNSRMALAGMVESEYFNTNNIAEVLSKHGDSRLQRAWGRYARKAGRYLSSIDVLLTSSATQARVSDLLFDDLKYQAKLRGVKVPSKDLADAVAAIQGLDSVPTEAAIQQAKAEFEQAYGAGVNLKSKEYSTLFFARVMEITRQGAFARAREFIMKNQWNETGKSPWAEGLDDARIQEILDEAKEVASKVGLVGTPPGTWGVFATMLKLPGQFAPGSQTLLGNMFANAPMNAAEKIMQGNTLVALPVLGIRLMKNQRGVLNSAEITRTFYERFGIRTKMYGRVTGKALGFDVNMEKKEMIARFIIVQAAVIPISWMATSAVVAAIASAFEDDEEKRDEIVRNPLEALSAIDENDRQIAFFGDKTAEPGSKEFEGQWKNVPFYVTGPMYGYTDPGAFSKMSSLKSTYGIEPYSIYAYGHFVGKYNDNPVIASVMGTVGANNDVMLFNNNPKEAGDNWFGVVLKSTMLQLSLVKDQAAVKPVMELVDAMGGVSAYEGVDKWTDRMKMVAAKKAAGLLSNLVLPAEAKNFNQDIMSFMGAAMDDPRTFIEYVYNRGPVMELLINKEKTDSFDFPIEVKTKRVLPIGTQGLMYIRNENGTVSFPQVDQVLNGPGGKYYAMFKKYHSDKFDKPDVSSYYVMEEDGPVNKKFTIDEQKLVRDEYKKIMRDFCDINYEKLRSTSIGLFGIELDGYLNAYNGNKGYQDYIVKKVIGEDAFFINMDNEEEITTKVNDTWRLRY